MDQTLNFYTVLFGLEITFFGIVVAAFLAFIQLIYSRFSSREVQSVIHDAKFLLFIILGIVNILIAASGFLILTLPFHNFVPHYHLSSYKTLTDPIVLSCILLLFLLSIPLLISLIVANIQYLQPHKLMTFIANKIQNEKLKNYLYQKFPIDPPSPIVHFNFFLEDPNIDEFRDEFRHRITGGLDAELRIEEKAAAALKDKYTKEEAAFEAAQRCYQIHNKRLKKSENPLQPLNEMCLIAINNLDFKTVEEFLNINARLFESFLKNISKNSKKDTPWNPESGLAKNYIKMLIESNRLLLEAADKSNVNSLRLKILEASRVWGTLLIDQEEIGALGELLEHWKRVADKYIEIEPEIFKIVLKLYTEIGERLFEKNNEDDPNINELFKNLGWLGERLLIKKAIEPGPLMPDNFEFHTEHDHLIEVLLRFGSKYNSEKPNWYPLIYFDAVQVVFSKILRSIKDKTEIELDHAIKNRIFDLCWVYSSFGEHAIHANNTRGAELAAVKLDAAILELNNENYRKKEAKDAINLLLDLGSKAAGFKEKLNSNTGFLHEPLVDHIIERIAVYGNAHGSLDAEILEILIKNGGDRDEVWSFITKLGKKMGTNFGLAFDETTGERYPDDDHRRRST